MKEYIKGAGLGLVGFLLLCLAVAGAQAAVTFWQSSETTEKRGVTSTFTVPAQSGYIGFTVPFPEMRGKRTLYTIEVEGVVRALYFGEDGELESVKTEPFERHLQVRGEDVNAKD